MKNVQLDYRSNSVYTFSRGLFLCIYFIIIYYILYFSPEMIYENGNVMVNIDI